MNKPYLVFMSGPNEYENIFELVDPIKPYIRGVCALIHDSNEFDKGVEYLLKINNELGAGNIIFGPYTGDHSLSRNRIFRETGIKDNDFLLIIDTLERVGNKFALNLSRWCEYMNDSNIDIIRYHVKPYLVRYREDLIYVGTPHESLITLIDPCLEKENRLRIIELSNDPSFKNESDIRINLRPIKRANDPKHFVNHYIKYLLQPNSNQNFLGLEHHGGINVLPKLEFLRKSLLKALRDNNLPRTTDGVKKLLSNGLNEVTRPIINGHKQVNDFYRYFILKDDTVTDSHTQESWDNMPKF
jgi:hypothetical protein